jgi:L-iditol 2-dehydrogenase
MRQAVMTSPGVIEYRKIDPPKPGKGQVLIRIQRIGICGSDLHVNHGKHPFTPYPVVQGHEFSAVVEAVGEGVKGIPLGSKVTATPQEVCGQCGPCKRGDYHICDHLKVRGFQAPGVAQDLYVTEAEKIVLLPDNFSPEQGALIEPISVAVHATSRVENMKSRNVAVLGAGPIGNLVAQVARARGAHVLITDLSDFRLEKAKACGIERISNSRNETLSDASKRLFGNEGFSLAFECAGVESTLSTAISSINKGGEIVVVAVYGEKPRVDMSIIGDRELKIIGTLMYQHKDYQKAVQLVAQGDVITSPLVTNHFSFERFADAYKFIDMHGEKTLKVMIDM